MIFFASLDTRVGRSGQIWKSNIDYFFSCVVLFVMIYVGGTEIEMQSLIILSPIPVS